jgi:hypothetical protein
MDFGGLAFNPELAGNAFTARASRQGESEAADSRRGAAL